MVAHPQQPGSPATIAAELFEARRSALVERVSLEMHDALAPEGASFTSARSAAGAWVDAVAAAIASHYAPSAVSLLNQQMLHALDAGSSLATVVSGVNAAIGAMTAVAAEHDPRIITIVARAAGGVGSEVASAAARSLEERARTQIKRRADRADRFREAAASVASAALQTSSVLQALTRAAVVTLDCDWAAVALREADGQLAIAALDGRGAGWAQRWELTEASGFAARVLASDQAVSVADAEQMGYTGPDPPASVVGAPLNGPGHGVRGLLFAGRDHGPLPDDDDASLAAALADVGGRALDTATRYEDSKRAAGQMETLAEAVRQATIGADQNALVLVARAAVEATGSDVALIRVMDEASGDLVTRGVYARSAALAAELEGTRVGLTDTAVAALMAGEELVTGALTDAAVLTPVSERLGGVDAAGLPIIVDGRPHGALLIARAKPPYRPDDLRRARGSVAHAGMLVVLDRVRRHARVGAAHARAELERLGEALAAGSDEPRIARLLARLAAEALGATRALLYRGTNPDDLILVAGYGFRRDELAAAPGRALAAEATSRGEVVVTGGEASGVAALAGAGLSTVLTAPLVSGDTVIGALQVFFQDRDQAAAAGAPLSQLAPAATQALERAGESHRRDDALRRMSALVEIAAQAAASASLEQTLAAVGEHVTTLMPGSQAGVYVLDEGRIVLSEPDTAVAAVHGAVLTALLRDAPPTGEVLVADTSRDARLEALRNELAEAHLGSVLVAPLRFREHLIGAICLAAREPGSIGEREVELLRWQAPSIALALQSAVLASQASRLESELSTALAAERSARGELEAQDTVVRAVAEGWDRPRAAAAVARAVCELVDADAAAVLVSRSGDEFALDALHVASPALDEPVRRIIRRARAALPAATLTKLTGGESVITADADVAELSAILGPLLAPGASAGLVPLRLGGTLSSLLVVISLDPAHPIDAGRMARAERFAPQALLALRG